MNITNLRTTRPIFQQKENFPDKLPLTEREQEFEPFLKELRILERNIITQKQNLREFYSAQDRCDYRELLKRRKNLVAKLTRMAKQDATEYYEIAFEIKVKKDYNRFAPKILRAKTPKELQEVINLISTYTLYVKVKEMLAKIIQQKKF